MTSTAAESEYTSSVPPVGSLPTGTPVDEGTLDTLKDTKLSVDDSVYLPLIVRGNLIPSLPIPTPPVESVSFYVSSLAFDFQEMGRVRGAIDRERGNIETVVIFAFGRPETRVDPRDGTTLTGSLLPLTNTFVTTVQIRAVIEQFASGYAAGVSGNPDAFVILVVGTSNDKDNDEPDNVNASHAEQWGLMMENLESWLASNNLQIQIDVAGRNDIELAWNDPQTTRVWVDAYHTTTDRQLYNFGDAAGCPPSGGAPAGGDCDPGAGATWVWQSEDVWYVSRGVGNTFPIPQIYNRDPENNPAIISNAEQWTLLKVDSINRNRVPLLILGTLTQKTRCDDLVRDQDDDVCARLEIDNTSEQGWLEMYNELNDFPETEQSVIPYRTDIREPRTGRDF